jgi:hypothetical protein
MLESLNPHDQLLLKVKVYAVLHMRLIDEKSGLVCVQKSKIWFCLFKRFHHKKSIIFVHTLCTGIAAACHHFFDIFNSTY